MASAESEKVVHIQTNRPEQVEQIPIHSTLAARIPLTAYQVFFSCVMAFAGFMVGFDTSYSGTVLQMPSFNTAFGHCAESPSGQVVCRLSATQQSLTFISALFTALGCGLTGFVGHYLGRKGALQIGCVVVSIGAAGQLGTSGNYTNYMVCKCIAAVGVGFFSVTGPQYGVESTAPKRRGALFSLYNIGLGLGNFVVAAVCLGSSKLHTDWAWKTPIICQIPIAVMYIGVVFIFPESPRWLMTKGKESAARKSFAKLYNMEPDSPIVNEQIIDTQTSLEFEKALSSTSSWTELFHRTYIRRTAVATIALCASALCGSWFVVPYAAVFIGGLGIKSPFLINLAFNACIFGGSIIGPLTAEGLGRRRSMLGGYVIMGVCMLSFSAVSTGLGIASHTAQQTLIAFLCIWAFTFTGFIGPSSWLVANEVHSTRLRTYGQPFSALAAQICAFASSFWTPYMLNPQYGNMGTNVGYFYLGMTVSNILFCFFLVPETARLSLEQIDDLFASKKNPRHTSVAQNKRIAMGQEQYMSNEARDDAIEHSHQKGVAE